MEPKALSETAFIERDITEADVNAFAEVTGDKNPVHLDEEYAKKSIFGRRIAHGALTMSLISRVIAEKLPGQGSIYRSQACLFMRPVYIGDKIKAVVTVIEITPKTLPAPTMNVLAAKYRLRTECFNQNGEKVFDGEAEVLK